MLRNVQKSRFVNNCLLEFRKNINKSSTVTISDALKNRNDKSKINLNPEEQSNKKLLQLKKYNRCLSTLTPASLPLAANGTAVSKEEARRFMSFFPDIVRELTESQKHKDAGDIHRWMSKVLQYNVPGGKKNRGLATVMAYKILAKSQDLTEDNIKLVMILGWCVEMFQACYLVLDDVMDNSDTRRGQPCWYKTNDLGLAAINDGLLLEAGLFELLKKYFGQKDYYINLVDMFHDAMLKTTIGQSLDVRTAIVQPIEKKLALFTMDLYSSIVKYKTAYYSFYLPVALAMYMSGIKDTEVHRQTKTILLEMGHFFQVQDDFLDCFGDPTVTGKKGTDIQEGKCTWLSVVALQRASKDELENIMYKHYGRPDQSSVNKIKDLYEKLGLPNTYAIYEEDSFNMIRQHAQQVSRGVPVDLFFKIMDKIYRREC
uniref:Farnesyl pyrophosphate synthase n=1 Tax=Xenopsylla cheopis TaxID=163159 RepID=A0A6M2DRV7_XENCH